MTIRTRFLLALLSSLFVAGAAQAGNLAGRNALGFQGGLWGRSEATTSVIAGTVDVSGDGSVGGLGYVHWTDEAWALTVSVTALSQGDVEVRGDGEVRTSGADVVTLLLGARRYLPGATFGRSLRPFLAAAVGPAFGSVGEVRTADTVVLEAREETALGGYVGAGADILATDWLMIEFDFGYMLTSDFAEPVGGRVNYSGVQTRLGLSYLWGS